MRLSVLALLIALPAAAYYAVVFRIQMWRAWRLFSTWILLAMGVWSANGMPMLLAICYAGCLSRRVITSFYLLSSAKHPARPTQQRSRLASF
ncbi:hypothetical protein BGY98DRAFT_1001043 [Russula aff. rugulosa BPL654]|nr:hypothetical protein BGY98DRAFT_1001043 [Russula aff. rugulosa BPL654]